VENTKKNLKDKVWSGKTEKWKVETTYKGTRSKAFLDVT